MIADLPPAGQRRRRNGAPPGATTMLRMVPGLSSSAAGVKHETLLDKPAVAHTPRYPSLPLIVSSIDDCPTLWLLTSSTVSCNVYLPL